MQSLKTTKNIILLDGGANLFCIKSFNRRNENMGTKAREIIDLDVKELVKELNKALADEWLAYYQYWVGAKVAVGPMRGAVTAELVEHANEELKHAEMLSERILQLGGTPLLEPKKWYEETNCGYESPEDPSVKKLLKQNIKGEQCAIEAYDRLAKMTKDKDVTTYNLVVEILGDEIEHEEDLEAIMDDIEEMD
jgi:bacterioferritin